MPTEKIPQYLLDAMDHMNNYVNGEGCHDEDVSLNDQVDGHITNNNANNIANNVANNNRRNANRNAFRAGDMRPVWHWHEIRPGMFGYVKYLGFWHAVLVTGKNEERGLITAVHFAWPKFFSRRVVTEGEFSINLAERSLWEVYIPEDQKRAPEEAVRRARERVGQKGFNMFTYRSSHMVRECLVR